MIIRENQLLNQFSKEKNNYQPMLLYGSNEGLIRENINKVKNIFAENNAEEIIFTGKSIDEKPEVFNDELYTLSMFNDKKIIFIDQPIDKNVKLFESSFINLPNQLLIIVVAQNLSKSSKIRKLFENSEYYLSCPNYDDDLKSISQQINDLESNMKKRFDKDIKSYLYHNLSTDRMISKSEIEKIALLYLDSTKDPELNEIKYIFNDNAGTGLNKISQIVFSGNPKKVSILLNKIFDEGVNSVSVIRTMINYVQRIETTQIALKKTNNFDEAIRGLKPPVFWKDKDIFQNHCRTWPIKETINNFNILVNAELRCKSDYALTNMLCERALLKIATKGKIYFQ